MPCENDDKPAAADNATAPPVVVDEAPTSAAADDVGDLFANDVFPADDAFSTSAFPSDAFSSMAHAVQGAADDSKNAPVVDNDGFITTGERNSK
jgi:hypothetical protein